MYNLRTNKVVSRSQYVKTKHTPIKIIKAMAVLAEKGVISPDEMDPSTEEEVVDDEDNEP